MEPSKIVVRFRDGKVIKGFTQNFFPNKPVFHVIPQGEGGASRSVEIALDQLKAIFFVKDFSGDKTFRERKNVLNGDKPHGRLIEVTCTDGEVIVGTTTGYDPKRPGFFLFPIDAQWNNLKAYIVSAAVRNVRFL